MRHPNGLRAAAGNQGIGVLDIGDAFEGGFFAGYISSTANGVATHGLIIAPSASGYNGKATLQLKTSDTSTVGTSSEWNGAANSANMNNAIHPAAQYCEGLTIGGYTDWYLPAIYELDIAYQNLKPTTTLNSTSWGANPYSVPTRTVNRTAGAPAQTPLTAFQDAGVQAFVEGVHWSSTESSVVPNGSVFLFTNGSQGLFAAKTTPNLVRAFRKFAL
jgi:hypothetical protein